MLPCLQPNGQSSHRSKAFLHRAYSISQEIHGTHLSGCVLSNNFLQSFGINTKWYFRLYTQCLLLLNGFIAHIVYQNLILTLSGCPFHQGSKADWLFQEQVFIN